MKFKRYYFTEIYSNWIYKPEDIYHAIYDFYALSLINPDLLRDEELAQAMKEAKEINVNYIREFLLEQLERAVSAEIAHYLHFKKPEALQDYVPKWLGGGSSVIKFYKDYVKHFGNPNKLTSSGKLIIEPEILVYRRGYEDAYKVTREFMKKYGYSLYDLFNAAKYMFEDGSGWISDKYGGSAWVRIAEAGIKVLDTKNQNDIDKVMAVLDHVFDLEHNTGSIFTKNPHLDTYRIKKILDYKRDVTNEVSFYNKVSFNLKGPYMAAIKDLTGKTVESEKEKVELDDMLKSIRRDPWKIKYIKNPPKEVQRIAIEMEPMTLIYIENPDVELMKIAIDKDPTIIKYLNQKDIDRLPKDYIENYIGELKNKRAKSMVGIFQEI